MIKSNRYKHSPKTKTIQPDFNSLNWENEKLYQTKPQSPNSYIKTQTSFLKKKAEENLILFDEFDVQGIWNG